VGVADAGERVVVRPKRMQTPRGRQAWIGAALLFASVMARIVEQGVPGLVIAVVAAVATLLIGRWYLGHIRVEVGDDVRYKGLSRTRSWPRSEVGKALLVDGMVHPGTDQTWLIVLDRSDRRLFALTNQAWDDAGLAQVAQALGDRIERYPMNTSMRELNKTYPKAFNFVQLHPVVVVTALSLLVTFAAALAVIAFG
jgi:hypothetical protein